MSTPYPPFMKTSSLPWSLLALVATALADPLPYNPAQILRAPNSTVAYLFQASAGSGAPQSLNVLDIGKKFSASALPTIVASAGLPFLEDGDSTPYTTVVDGSGNITVITGSCMEGASSTALWRFVPDTASRDGNGTWTRFATTTESGLPAGSQWTGANYLAETIAFSASISKDVQDMTYYTFGGMCPFTNSSAAAWMTDAAYSQNMLAYDVDSTGNGSTYGINSVGTRGPPIPEAGFTITGLTPTFSVNAHGQPQSQQQDFLLIGGHTQQAFINTSNVALFSLPQESWAFVPVEQPSSARTDLTARQTETIVEPRSGHSAVLSEDGTSIIVLGGWVGDITNPAKPQLAVLHLGSEYGGDESEAWTWTIPAQSASFLSDGNGVYGHAAAMLPGGIMMVTGGYTVSESSPESRKRDASPNTYLYNVTSGSWVDEYDPSNAMAAVAAADTQPSSNGPLSSTSQQTGLGVGLGLGVLALAGVTCFYFWYVRKMRKQREERERALLCHSSDGSFMALDQPYDMDEPGIDGRGGDTLAAWEHESVHQMKHTGSTGLFTSIPSPTRGLRKGLQNRPYSFHAAPRYDERRQGKGSGDIHPIMERPDEDDSIRGDADVDGDSEAVRRLRRVEEVLDPDDPMTPERSLGELQYALRSSSVPIRDPFADPEPNPLGSHPVSPISPETLRRVPTYSSRSNSPTRRPLSAEMDGSMNWMIVETLEEPLDPSAPSSAYSNGRSSPERSDDRTSSTLSEKSQQSHASNTSITRTMSARTSAQLPAALMPGRNERNSNAEAQSPMDERTSTMGTISSTGRKTPSYFYSPARKPVPSVKSATESRTKMPGGMINAEKSTDTFTTAKSNFAQLQDEGQALLGGRPLMDRDDPYQRAMAATNPHTALQQNQQDMDLGIAPPRRRVGLIGSLRRALTAMGNNDRSFSFTSNAAERQYEREPRTSSSSPMRYRKPRLEASVSPRRTASDGSAWLRQKRGHHDWENDKSFAPYRDDPDPGDWGEGLTRTSQDERRAGEEWDVEGAVSRRDVQVMFTVPKSRLRVVNADVERASMRSASDGAVSRNNSIHSMRVRRQESSNTMRSRSDGEHTSELKRLSAMAEESEAQTTARDLRR